MLKDIDSLEENKVLEAIDTIYGFNCSPEDIKSNLDSVKCAGLSENEMKAVATVWATSYILSTDKAYECSNGGISLDDMVDAIYPDIEKYVCEYTNKDVIIGYIAGREDCDSVLLESEMLYNEAGAKNAINSGIFDNIPFTDYDDDEFNHVMAFLCYIKAYDAIYNMIYRSIVGDQKYRSIVEGSRKSVLVYIFDKIKEHVNNTKDELTEAGTYTAIDESIKVCDGLISKDIISRQLVDSIKKIALVSKIRNINIPRYTESEKADLISIFRHKAADIKNSIVSEYDDSYGSENISKHNTGIYKNIKKYGKNAANDSFNYVMSEYKVYENFIKAVNAAGANESDSYDENAIFDSADGKKLRHKFHNYYTSGIGGKDAINIIDSIAGINDEVLDEDVSIHAKEYKKAFDISVSSAMDEAVKKYISGVESMHGVANPDGITNIGDMLYKVAMIKQYAISNELADAETGNKAQNKAGGPQAKMSRQDANATIEITDDYSSTTARENTSNGIYGRDIEASLADMIEMASISYDENIKKSNIEDVAKFLSRVPLFATGTSKAAGVITADKIYSYIRECLQTLDAGSKIVGLMHEAFNVKDKNNMPDHIKNLISSIEKSSGYITSNKISDKWLIEIAENDKVGDDDMVYNSTLIKYLIGNDAIDSGIKAREVYKASVGTVIQAISAVRNTDDGKNIKEGIDDKRLAAQFIRSAMTNDVETYISQYFGYITNVANDPIIYTLSKISSKNIDTKNGSVSIMQSMADMINNNMMIDEKYLADVLSVALNYGQDNTNDPGSELLRVAGPDILGMARHINKIAGMDRENELGSVDHKVAAAICYGYGIRRYFKDKGAEEIGVLKEGNNASGGLSIIAVECEVINNKGKIMVSPILDDNKTPTIKKYISTLIGTSTSELIRIIRNELNKNKAYPIEEGTTLKLNTIHNLHSEVNTNEHKVGSRIFVYSILDVTRKANTMLREMYTRIYGHNDKSEYYIVSIKGVNIDSIGSYISNNSGSIQIADIRNAKRLTIIIPKTTTDNQDNIIDKILSDASGRHVHKIDTGVFSNGIIGYNYTSIKRAVSSSNLGSYKLAKERDARMVKLKEELSIREIEDQKAKNEKIKSMAIANAEIINAASIANSDDIFDIPNEIERACKDLKKEIIILERASEEYLKSKLKKTNRAMTVKLANKVISYIYKNKDAENIRSIAKEGTRASKIVSDVISNMDKHIGVIKKAGGVDNINWSEFVVVNTMYNSLFNKDKNTDDDSNNTINNKNAENYMYKYDGMSADDIRSTVLTKMVSAENNIKSILESTVGYDSKEATKIARIVVQKFVTNEDRYAIKCITSFSRVHTSTDVYTEDEYKAVITSLNAAKT